MTKVNSVSPILANSLNQNSNNHPDKIYQHLTKHANDVKPNEPKARLVRENPFQAAKSSVTDVFQDGKNLTTAIKTGKMDDNSLGRINDLGMKFGSLLIAGFLAAHSKTKTQTIMRFLGGGTFLATMSLWPKLFINLPARLVHGFRIDDKYISAQGEKKDFFLDNQFLPWDAYSDAELRENAKRAGIDYDSENGKEKIQRKMQKTALQNRTLWMATAGFATPLITAVVGDRIEPHIKNSVIQHGFRKSREALANLDDNLNSSNLIIKNEKELEQLINKYQENLDDAALKEISSKLNLNFNDIFKDSDNAKPIRDLSFSVDTDTLKEIRKQTSIIDDTDLETLLKNLFVVQDNKPQNAASKFRIKGVKQITVSDSNKLTSQAIDEVVKQFRNLEEGRTYSKLSEMLLERVGKDEKAAKQINQKLSKLNLKYTNDAPFFDIIKQYNNDILPSIRGKLKTYLDILNPVAGSTDESVDTKIYRDTMNNIIQRANFTKEDLEALKADPIIKPTPKSVKVLQNFFSQIASLDDKEYIEALESLQSKENTQEYLDFLKQIGDKENIRKITQLEGNAKNPLFEVMNQHLEHKINKNITHFLNVANQNIDSINLRCALSANVERQIMSGTFEKALKEKGLLTESMPIEKWCELARNLIYEGTSAMEACKMELPLHAYRSLREIIYDKNNYKLEMKSKSLSGIERLLDILKNMNVQYKEIVTTGPEKTAAITGIGGLLRTSAKEMLNNKAWKKVFVPMTLALIAVTLLVQPFFGNIKDEFGENKKKEVE